MATLSGTIDKQELMDRFRDYLETEVNNSIVWNDSNRPTMDTSPVSAGTTAVVEILSASLTRNASSWIDGDFAVTSSTFTNGTDQVIRAAELYNKFQSETNKMCQVRKVRIQGRVSGEGGNIGSRLTTTGNIPGRAYIELTDQTEVTYVDDVAVRGSLGPVAGAGIIAGNPISDEGLETLFSNLRDAYRTARDTVFLMAAYLICHSSCHSSCHGSRGRR